MGGVFSVCGWGVLEWIWVINICKVSSNHSPIIPLLFQILVNIFLKDFARNSHVWPVYWLSFIPALCCSCLLVLPPDILDKNNTFRDKLKFWVKMLLHSEKENSADRSHRRDSFSVLVTFATLSRVPGEYLQLVLAETIYHQGRELQNRLCGMASLKAASWPCILGRRYKGVKSRIQLSLDSCRKELA